MKVIFFWGGCKPEYFNGLMKSGHGLYHFLSVAIYLFWSSITMHRWIISSS